MLTSDADFRVIEETKLFFIISAFEQLSERATERVKRHGHGRTRLSLLAAGRPMSEVVAAAALVGLLASIASWLAVRASRSHRRTATYHHPWSWGGALLAGVFWGGGFVSATPGGALTKAEFKQATWGECAAVSTLSLIGVALSAPPPTYPRFRAPLLATLTRSLLPPLSPTFPSHPTSTSTDWVQGSATATAKWGDIGDWDVSDVKDFSNAFSTNRNGGNPKAATFVGTAISKWITTSVTSLFYTFYGGRKSEMNADLSGWTVGKVTNLQSTFSGASKFAGTGLSSWDTSNVNTLKYTFNWAGRMNADLSAWKVSKVTTLEETFDKAAKFTGVGLDSWDISKVKTMTKTFNEAKSLTACNKRKIADAWAAASDPGGSVFTATTYDTDWSADACAVPLTDATFKQASWGKLTFNSLRPALTV